MEEDIAAEISPNVKQKLLLILSVFISTTVTGGNPEAVILFVVDNTDFERLVSVEILIEDKEVLRAYSNPK